MRQFLTVLMATCLLAQQFVCCAEGCGPCTSGSVSTLSPPSHGNSVIAQPIPHSHEHHTHSKACRHHAAAPTQAGHSHHSSENRTGDAPQHPHDGPHHHLCVATHLFYVTAGSNSGWAPVEVSFWIAQPLNAFPVELQQTDRHWCLFDSDVERPASRRLRARLNVWNV